MKSTRSTFYNTLILISFICSSLKGFSQVWEEGKYAVSAGYGIPNFGKVYLPSIITSTYTKNSTNVPLGIIATGTGPMHLKGEYGITHKFGLGLSINYQNYGATWAVAYSNYNNGNYVTNYYHYAIKANAMAFLLRFNRHFEAGEKIDLYWGAGFGYNLLIVSGSSDDPGSHPVTVTSPIPFAFETTFGMRYYFSQNIGAYIEGGYAKDILQAGISVKF